MRCTICLLGLEMRGGNSATSFSVSKTQRQIGLTMGDIAPSHQDESAERHPSPAGPLVERCVVRNRNAAPSGARAGSPATRFLDLIPRDTNQAAPANLSQRSTRPRLIDSRFGDTHLQS